MYTQMTVYPFVWSPKPPWETVMRWGRRGTESAGTGAGTILPEQSPVAYYDRLLRLRQGPALRLGWALAGIV